MNKPCKNYLSAIKLTLLPPCSILSLFEDIIADVFLLLNNFGQIPFDYKYCKMETLMIYYISFIFLLAKNILIKYKENKLWKIKQKKSL